MNLISFENILTSNLFFLYFYLTGGIITSKYIKGNLIIKNSINIFFGITAFITFLSVANIILNFSINLFYLITFYSVVIFFFIKKDIFNKYFFFIFFINLIIFNSLPYTVITYDSLLYTQIAKEYDFLVKNNLFQNYLSDNFTSIIYLIYIYDYFNENFLLNIFPLIGFSLIFLIIQDPNKRFYINKKKVIFWTLITLFFFSRNFIQHIFYLNSHLIVATTVFLILYRSKEIIMSETLYIIMIISLIFLRTETFIIILIILFLDFLALHKRKFSKKIMLYSILACGFKIIIINFNLNSYSLYFNQANLLIIYSFLIIFLVKIIFFNNFKIIKNESNIKFFYRFALAIFLLMALIDNERILLFTENMLFNSLGWGITWYIIFGYTIFRILTNKIESYYFHFGIIYIFSIILIINFTDINLRDGFGDSTNRIMLHVMPVFLYEILNMFKPYYNKKFNFLN